MQLILFNHQNSCYRAVIHVVYIYSDIHAIRPGLSGTVPDFDTLPRRPRNYGIVPVLRTRRS